MLLIMMIELWRVRFEAVGDDVLEKYCNVWVMGWIVLLRQCRLKGNVGMLVSEGMEREQIAGEWEIKSL